MRYLLTVLTNGRPVYLERTLAAFERLVWPQPAEVYIYDDGLTTPPEAFEPYEDATVGGTRKTVGMCEAHAHCWQAAADSGYDWVFHIEDDYVILRPVDLLLMKKVMNDRPSLAQMALYRTPWGAEVEYGGYVAQTPGWYKPASLESADESISLEWLETKRNWATNPALFRTELARAFPWPRERGCETTIGPQIIEARSDAKFGIWGWGEPWVAHIGVDRARGAFGY